MMIVGFKIEETGKMGKNFVINVAKVIVVEQQTKAEDRVAERLKGQLDKIATPLLEESLGEGDSLTIFDKKEINEAGGPSSTQSHP